MSESKYESKITSAPCSAQQIYRVLSNLQNLERVKDLIPKDKVQEMDIEPDRVRFKVDGLAQKITIAIVDRIENDTIKFGAEGIPMDANFWIQMKEVSPTDTRLKLTVKADIPFMFKFMVEKKLQTGLDQAAEMLAQFKKVRQEERTKKTVSLRLSSATLKKAKEYGKGYTSFLSRLLDLAIQDESMVRKCL